ncbi:CopG family transcriptional regulator [Candidatus Bathyarchaeota archaeon]|nr:MAG: CopG family transcriptional regulator [Candidatus Bathyarchaeota archaeon]
MRKISIRLTEQQYEFLETLVSIGEYASISEAIRDAIRKLISEKSELLERASKLRSYM